MFGRGKEENTPKQDQRQRPASEIIEEACNRNIPICVVRPEKAGRVPMARGRMLEFRGEMIDIDQVTVPGLEVDIRLGDDLQAYFSIGRTLYHFKTRLEKMGVPKHLNARMVIPAMMLRAPKTLVEGDRRNTYRVSVSARADRPLIQAWRLLDIPQEEAEDESDLTPSGALPSFAINMHGVGLEAALALHARDPDYEGWIVDATEEGLGLRIEACRPSRFGIFEPLLLRLVVPADAERPGNDGSEMHTLDFLAEVRTKRAVGDDGSRLGLVLIDETDMQAMRKKKRLLREYLSLVQRDQLRKNRSGAA